MEQGNALKSTQNRKKIKKITSTAAIILCVVCFIFGLLIGKGFSSGKKLEEAQTEISKLEQDLDFEKKKESTQIATLKEEVAELNEELAEANKQVKELGGQTAKNEDAEEPATESEDNETDNKKPGSGFKRVLTIFLVLIILGCIGFAAFIFLKKGHHDNDTYFDDDDYDDEYDDDDEYEDDDEYDDDDEYEDDDEYDDDDEYEDDDDEYEDDEYEDDEE